MHRIEQVIPKKLMFFHFETRDPEILIDIINSRPFIELEKCGAPETKGFFPLSPQDQEIAFTVRGSAGEPEYIFFNFRKDWKDIPAKPLKEAIKKAISEYEIQLGHDATPDEKTAIAGQVHAKLLERAFEKSSITTGWVDIANKIIVFESSSEAPCVAVIKSFLERRAERDDFRAAIVRTQKKPVLEMTRWIQSLELPPKISLDDHATFKFEMGGKVAISKKNLETTSVQHISNGGQCTEVAITLEDLISIKVHSDLGISKIESPQFLQYFQDQVSELPDDMVRTKLLRLKGAFAKKVFDHVVECFGGLRVADPANEDNDTDSGLIEAQVPEYEDHSESDQETS